MASVKEKIFQLYETDAQSVVDLINNNPMCIVGGAHASGKSHFLLPRAEQLLRQQGYFIQNYDSAGFYGSLRYKGVDDDIRLRFPKTELGIAILDEAGSVSSEGLAATKNVLSLIHEQGYRVIPVIPYRFGKFDRSPSATNMDIWQQAEQEISGLLSPVFHLESKRLDEQLARELLSEPQPNRPDLSPEVIDFILLKVPYNLRILDQLRNRSYILPNVSAAANHISLYFTEWRKWTSSEEWRNK